MRYICDGGPFDGSKIDLKINFYNPKTNVFEISFYRGYYRYTYERKYNLPIARWVQL